MPMRRRLFTAALLAALSAIGIAAQTPQSAQTFDLLITNARIFDGTGNPAFPADVGVRDGRIVAIGRFGGATAGRVIDATGKFVSPGFIDIHSHADDGGRARGGFRDENPQVRAAPNLVTQGITTVVRQWCRGRRWLENYLGIAGPGYYPRAR